MVTLAIRSDAHDAPDVMLVPIGSIRRIELRAKPEERVASFGFSVPPAR
jgi:hypothetical protein